MLRSPDGYARVPRVVKRLIVLPLYSAFPGGGPEVTWENDHPEPPTVSPKGGGGGRAPRPETLSEALSSSFEHIREAGKLGTGAITGPADTLTRDAWSHEEPQGDPGALELPGRPPNGPAHSCG